MTPLATVVLLLAGLSTVGWLWLVAHAFGSDEQLWGLGGLFFPPLALIYGLIHYNKVPTPVWFVGIGVAVNLFLKVTVATTSGG